MKEKLQIIYNVSELNDPTAESFIEHFERKAKKLLRILKNTDDHKINVRVTIEGYEFIVKVELSGPKLNLFSTEKHEDFRIATNKVIDEIITMIKKQTSK
jgi:ribosome-associated translation inhibitor RaiA